MKNTATVTKYTKISYPFLKSDQDHIWSGKELKGGGGGGKGVEGDKQKL